MNKLLAVYLGISSAVANAALMFAPILVGAMVYSRFTTNQAITLISAELLATAVVAFPALIWEARSKWQICSRVSLVLILICNLASAVTDGFFQLLILRVITGMAEGVLLILFLLVISQDDRPEKLFSGKLMVQMATGACGLGLFALLVPLWGVSSLYIVLALAAALLLIPVSLLPNRNSDTINGSPKFSSRALKGLGAIALLSLLLLGAGVNLVWTFLERIGSSHYISLELLGMGLSLAVFVAIGGSMICARVGTAYGRFIPISIGLALGIIGCFILTLNELSVGVFFAGALMVSLARVIPIPYLFGCLAVLDEDKKLSILSHVCLSTGMAIGPVLGLAIQHQVRYDMIGWVAAGLMLAVLIMAVRLTRIARHKELALRAKPD